MRGDYEMYEYTPRDMDEFMDLVKATVVRALVADGEVPKEAGEAWCRSHVIIRRPKSFFRTISNLWSKAKESKHGDHLLVVNLTHPLPSDPMPVVE